MDSADLLLIEISGEDDSLLSLQDDVSTLNIINNNNNTTTTTTTTFFSSSPLLRLPRSNRPLLRSPIGSMKGNEDGMGKQNASSSHTDSSSSMDSVNKENLSMNKPEVPKLSIEPQQMKRKKKGGGYNLRKSLAWDRAFFTEEGVLDPVELSMLSGNVDKSSKGMLSVISEGRESLSCGLDGASDSPDLQALEDNLFKALPANTPNKGRKIAGILSPKPDSSARDEVGSASTAKRKVLSAHDINRSASKRSGCPRPVALSSLKRPPNVGKTKTAIKDSKVAKPLAPKPDPLVVSMASRSSITSARLLTRNQIPRPAVNAQKSIGLKGPSTNTKNAQKNDVKPGPAGKLIAKSTFQNARRNMVSSVPERHLLANVQTSEVSQAKNTSKVLLDPALPAASHAPNDNDASSKRTAVSFSQNACYNGGSMQFTQSQIAKPSGLRMPSPSLGFFHQSKPSGSHSLLQRNALPGKLPESSVPNLRKVGASNPIHHRPPQPMGKIPVLSNTESSASSIVNTTSHGHIKSDLELDNTQKVEVRVLHNSKTNDTLNYQQQLHSICDDAHLQSLDHPEPCKVEKIPHMEDIGLQRNDNTLLLQGVPCKQWKDNGGEKFTDVCPNSDSTGSTLDYPNFVTNLTLPMEIKDLSGTDIMISSKHGVNRQYNECIKNHNVNSESRRVDLIIDSNKCTSKGHEDQISDIHDMNKQFTDQAELSKSDACEVFPVSHMESQRLLTNRGTLLQKTSSSEELHKCNSSNAADASLKVQDCGANELETFYRLSHCKAIGCTKDGTDRIYNLNSETQLQSVDGTAGTDNISGEAQLQSVDVTEGIDNLSRELHVGDELQPVDGNLSAESGKSTLSSSAVDNPHLVIDNLCKKSAKQLELPRFCLVTEQAFQDGFGSHSTDCFSSGKRFSSKDSQRNNVLQSEKPVVSKRNDASEGVFENSNVSSISHCKQDCGFDVSEEAECLNMKCALSASANGKAMDEELHGEASSSELERMDKAHVVDTPAICPTEAASFFLCSGDLGRSKPENPNVTSQSPLMHVEVASDVHDMSENEGIVDKQHDSLVQNCFQFFDFQSGNDASHIEGDTSIMHNDCSSVKHDVNEQSLEQAMVINSSSGGSGSINQIQLAYDDLVCNESRSFGDSWKFINGNNADVGATCGSGYGSLHGSCKSEIMELPNEIAGVNNMIKETPNEDAQVQSIVGSLSVDSCYRNVNTSVENKKSSMMVDDISEQPVEHPKLQNPDLLTEQVPLENRGLCSGDKLLLVNMSSVQSQERDASGNLLGASEQYDSCSSQSGYFDVCIHASTVMQDGSLDVDRKVEDLSTDDAMSDAFEIGPSAENIECYMDYNVNIDKIGDQATSEFDSSSMKSGDQIPPASTRNSMPFYSFSKKSELLQKSNDTSSGNILQDIETSSSNGQAPAVIQDVGLDVDKLAAHLCINDAVSGVNEIEPSDENIECSMDYKYANNDKVGDQATLELDSSLMKSVDQILLAGNACNSKPFRSLIEESELLHKTNETSGVCILQDIEANLTQGNILPEEAEIVIPQKNNSVDIKFEHELHNVMYHTEDTDATPSLKNSVDDKKQDAPVIKPPPNAIPFSDEWLATFEAAGEEILTMKGGAVQNSPPDKSLPEPSPWSPVRRKNNQGIGPYDCTKFTNTNTSSSTSN